MAGEATGNERGAQAAERLLTRKDEVLRRFSERVRARVPAAANADDVILVNTLPSFLERLAEALSPRHPRVLATDGDTSAEEHGSERVRLTGYRPDDVVREYQILRDVVLETLAAAGAVDDRIRHVVTSSIDQAVLIACTAYALAQETVREQFTLALTHDLRGPLTAVRANATLVLRRPDSPEVPRWAARIVDTTERMDRMIRDLLDVSRLRTGSRLSLALAPAELVALVREVIEHFETTIGERFVLHAPEPIEGVWSVDTLRRAVENLCSNAIKYGAPETPVTVTVRQFDGRARIEVHNAGSFISIEERETLFRAFQRTQSALRSGKQGWGIGLALVRGVAEAHGGSIEVDSTREAGTTFAMDIPRDARPFQEVPTLEPTGRLPPPT